MSFQYTYLFRIAHLLIHNNNKKNPKHKYNHNTLKTFPPTPKEYNMLYKKIVIKQNSKCKCKVAKPHYISAKT